MVTDLTVTIYSERQKYLYFRCGVRSPGAHTRVRPYRYVGYVSHVPVGADPWTFTASLKSRFVQHDIQRFRFHFLCHVERNAVRKIVILNEAKRSEESPEGFQNIGKSRSCQHSGILQDCFHRAIALKSHAEQSEAGKGVVILNEAKRSEESPDSFQNIGKSLFCRLPGILHEILQRFALQAFQRSGKCSTCFAAFRLACHIK